MNLGNSNLNQLTSHPGKGLGARRVALSARLAEDGIAPLGDGVECRVLPSEALRGGTEEGEA